MRGRGRSPETEALFRRFSALAPGVENAISFAEVESILHANPRIGAGYSKVKTAREIALRENKICIGVDKNSGYYRLTDTEIFKTGGRSIRGISQRAERGLAVSICAEVASMTPEQRSEHSAVQAVLHAVFVNTATMPRQLSAVESNDKIFANTIAAFSRHG